MRAPAIAFVGLMLMVSSAGSAELIVLSGQGATPGVREVAAAFARTSGHKATVLQPANAELQQRLDHGPADILVASPEPIEDLVKKGRLVSDTATPWVLAGLGVSVRAGAPKPDIGTVEAYKAALIAAKSIGYSFGCSGTNVAEGIEKLGLTEQLKPKTTRTGSQGGGGPVTDYLARGDFDSASSRATSWWGCRGPLRRPGPRLPEHAVSVQRRDGDGLAGAGGRARVDQVHDLARGRAARAQDLRGAGTLSMAPLADRPSAWVRFNAAFSAGRGGRNRALRPFAAVHRCVSRPRKTRPWTRRPMPTEFFPAA